MRLSTHTLLFLAALAATSAAPARAQAPGTPSAPAPSQEIDPCTGKPRRDPAAGTSANPAQSGVNASQPGSASSTASGTNAAQPGSASSTASGANASQPGTASSTASGANASQPGSASSTASGVNASQPGTASSTASGANASQPGTASSTTSGANASQPASASSTASGADGPQTGGTPRTDGVWSNTGVVDTTAARRNRAALRLGTGMPNQVRLGPAASVSVPTAFGVDAGEVFAGIGYQGRTRYTEEDDAAAVAGLGIGKRSLVALEVALTSYSTLRGAPLETGGLSFKVHRALPGNTSVAVGWENAVRWGGSDDEGSIYGVATRVVSLKDDPSEAFSMAVFTLGVGDGRFRFEKDDAAGKETVNVFAAAGLRVAEQVSLVGDWTGQDLNVAASFTPFPRVPLVLTTGLADLTGSAGDGIRFILSLGYGTSIRLPR